MHTDPWPMAQAAALSLPLEALEAIYRAALSLSRTCVPGALLPAPTSLKELELLAQAGSGLLGLWPLSRLLSTPPALTAQLLWNTRPN